MRYEYHGSRLRELLDMVLSLTVIGVAFSIRYLHLKAYDLALASSIAVGIGFLLHEAAHRLTAKAFGCISRYRAWYPGLVLALVVAIATRGGIIFASPGAVEVLFPWYIPRAEAIISLAGPMTNLAIAAICLPLYAVSFLDSVQQYIVVIGSANAFLGFFNLLPIPPLDGFKAFRGGAVRWLMVFMMSLILLPLCYL